MTTVILILVLLLGINAILAASELAVMTSRSSRLQVLAQRGNRRARWALLLAQEPSRFLSTVSVGVTAITILFGAVGEHQFVDPLTEWLSAHTRLSPKNAEIAAFVVVVSVITYVTLLVGELIPKRIALAYPERMAVIVAPVLAALSWIGAPVIKVLSLSTDGVVRLMGIRQRADDVNEEDVKAVVRRAASTGVLGAMEHQLFERALRMRDMTVRSLMVPRTQITWIDVEMPVEDVRVLIGTAPFSHFPVCAGDIDHLKGVVHVKDLIAYGLLAGTDFVVSSVAQAPLYVPDSMPALKLLDLLQRNRSRVAFVVDEHGSLEGLVTANDVVQAIVGDMSRMGEDEAPSATRREDGSFLLDGRLPLAEMLATLELAADSAEDYPNVATAAGLVTALIGKLPATGEKTKWHGWTFEVVDLDGQRVDKLLATRDVKA